MGGRNNSSASGLSSMTGILIKKILPDSPAAAARPQLKIGDRLLEVGGVDLLDATHDEAVEVIKHARSPVKFRVQSLIPYVSIHNRNYVFVCVSSRADSMFAQTEQG